MYTKKTPVAENYHGKTVIDEYRWLEDIHDQDLQQWIEQQNEKTRRFLDTYPDKLQIRRRLHSLMNYPKKDLPQRAADWYVYQYNDGLQNQPVIVRQKGLAGEPEEVFDPNTADEAGTTAVSHFSLSADGRYMAYSLSAAGSDQQSVRIRDLETKTDFPETLQWCKFTNLAWLGSEGFFYSRFPEPGTVPPEDENNYHKVYFHRLGENQARDELIYEQPQKKELRYSPEVSEDESYVVLHAIHGTGSRTGIYYRAIGSGQPFTHLLDVEEARYEFIGSREDRFFLKTNHEAPKGRVIAIDLQNPQEDYWQDIIPEQEDVLHTVVLAGGRLAAVHMRDAHHVLNMYDLDGSWAREIPLPGLGSVAGLFGRDRHPELLLSFTSFLMPPAQYRWQGDSGDLEMFAEPPVVEDFNPEDYEVSQVFYSSKDGTKIPMFVIHRQGLAHDGSHPALLYGYGGFNISITPFFDPTRILWLEQGGVFAVANLRGGGEYGEAWHQAGMRERKQNVFDDFQCAAQWLVANQFTCPDRLAIEGRSNGGLLTAVCALQRPDLYGAVVCGVPVTDMLRFHKFTVGSYWVPEFGDPDNSADFPALYAYSPLHNSQKAVYPPMLITTGDHDDRVVPAHAYKFAAVMQEKNEGPHPVLLRIDTDAGHGHGKPTSKIIQEHTDVYAFLFRTIGDS